MNCTPADFSKSVRNKPTGSQAGRAALTIAVFLGVLSSIAVTSPVLAASSALSANKELAATIEKLNALTVWFNEADKQRAQWQQEIRNADQQVAKLGRRVADLKDAVVEIEEKQNQLSREAKELEIKRHAEGARISEHLNAAYRMSGQDFFKLLLNQENPEQFDRMIRYHQYFSAERSKTLQGYRDTLRAIDANRTQAETTRVQLKEQRANAATEQKVFTSGLTKRKALVAELDRNTRNKLAEQSRLEQDQSRLRALLQELAKLSEQADGKEFAGRKGALPRPTNGQIRSSFGQPRADGRLRWQGNYVETKPGAIIRSVHRGKVVFAEWLRGFGLLTIVDHGDGYMSLYGYADVLLKEPGDRVESGEQIANSGRSGGQQTDGLYFEIRKDGKPVDPTLWLRPTQSDPD